MSDAENSAARSASSNACTRLQLGQLNGLRDQVRHARVGAARALLVAAGRSQRLQAIDAPAIDNDGVRWTHISKTRSSLDVAAQRTTMGACGRTPLDTRRQIARVALKPSMIGTAAKEK
jgi:hypothetical protein